MSHTGLYNVDLDNHMATEPLAVPFNLGLTPPVFGSDDAPAQEIAMASALMAPDRSHDSGEGFFTQRAKEIPLSKLERWHNGGRARNAIGLLQSWGQVTYDKQHTTAASDADLC